MAPLQTEQSSLTTVTTSTNSTNASSFVVSIDQKSNTNKIAIEPNSTVQKQQPTLNSPNTTLTSSDTATLTSHITRTSTTSVKMIEKNSQNNSKPDFLEYVKEAMRSTKPLNSRPTTQRFAENVTGTGNGATTVTARLPPRPPQPSHSQKIARAHNAAEDRNTSFDSEDGLLINEKTRRVRASTPISAHKSNSLSLAGSGSEKNTSPIEISIKLPISSQGTQTFASTTTKQTFTSTRHRSPSPAYSVHSENSYRSTTQHKATSSQSSLNLNFGRLQTPPRRIFPQTYTQGHHEVVTNLEPAPVIFDGNLSFVLGCKKQPVHQTLRASPSYQDPRTSSAHLSEKIQNFLRRTDHVQEEWSALSSRSRRATSAVSWHGGGRDSGRTTPTNSLCSEDFDTISLIERQRERNSMERRYPIGHTRSAQNILTKAFQMSRNLPRFSNSRSTSASCEPNSGESDDDVTIQEEDDDRDLSELSEMTVDLVEERSAGTLNSERLEAETSERLKFEKELEEQHKKVKNLQETTEKLEMELIYAKSGMNGLNEEEDLENEEGCGPVDGSVYKLKYERIARELEFTKRRLQTQHEHDLEQLIGLKKQLEKKLNDAYEEVEEQRQVVGQWKRKTQKMTNEMNDLRMLLEEQNSRNNLLEKRQRKFDVETQSLLDTVRQERQAKERICREKDVLMAEKFTLEQSLADTRLELELKDEKFNSVQRELEEFTFSGNMEEEMAQLRRTKNELERRLKEQEEELDEMAGQIQLLEQAKLRLEMNCETLRKDSRREAQQRDEEQEEARGAAFKKIKALECQLEAEHSERSLLVREKHELERRLASMQDMERDNRQKEEATSQKLRRDLRKYKALLKDSHAQLERLKAETPGKTLIRQLRNQLEDAESARSSAIKSRQTAEADLTELQALFEESQKGRNDAEDRANAAHRDRAELQAQIEENEEELAELMKKYSGVVKQLNTEKISVSESEFKISELEAERNSLKVQVSELQQRLESMENIADPTTTMLSKRLELRTKELESRLELEQATRTRLETQISRHKEALEKTQSELSQAKMREMQAQEGSKKAQKSLREMREEFNVIAGREQDSVYKRKELEKKLENCESEIAALRNDLRLALQRIADLQQAMEEGDEAELSEDDDSDTTDASLSDEHLSSLRVPTTKTDVQTTRTLARDDDGNPRVTLTSPTTLNIPKLVFGATAKTAKAAGKI